MTNQLQYNFDGLFVNKNQFERTLDNGGFYKIPISNKKTNIVSSLFQGDYVATTIYIIKKTHILPKIKSDGELLIQHKSLTNNDKPLYVSIPLRTQKGIVSNIDLLTQPNTDVTLNLNEDIYSKKSSYYENENERVVILNNILNVGINFDKYSTGKIINPKTDYISVETKPLLGYIEGQENISEGSEENQYQDIATYCVPIDEENHTIMNEANINVPADGKVSANKTIVSQLTTATNFLIFFAISICVVWTMPSLYHFFIVLLVMENYNLNRQQLLNRLSGADIFTSIIFIGLSLTFITNGLSTNNTTLSVIGFYFIMFYMITFARLQYDRLLNNGDVFKKYIENMHESMKTQLKELIRKTNGIDVKDVPYFQDVKIDMQGIQPDIIGLINDNLSYVFLKNNGALDFINIGIFCILFLILLGIRILISNLKSKSKSKSTSIFTNILFYMVFIIIYLIAYFKYSYKNEDNEIEILQIIADKNNKEKKNEE